MVERNERRGWGRMEGSLSEATGRHCRIAYGRAVTHYTWNVFLICIARRSGIGLIRSGTGSMNIYLFHPTSTSENSSRVRNVVCKI